MIELLFSHFLADFVLQNDYLAKNKSKNLYILFVHCFIYAFCISFVFKYFHVYTIFKFLIILISHLIIDTLKIKNKINFSLDQILHILINLILFYI